MIQAIFLQNNVGRNDGVNIFYDFRFSFVRNKKYCLKRCSYYFPFCVICSLKSTNVPLAGHNYAISRHFAGISIFEKRITQKPFTLHLFLGIPCVYRGFRGRRVHFHPSSPFMVCHFLSLKLFSVRYELTSLTFLFVKLLL